MNKLIEPKWQKKLKREIKYANKFHKLNENDWLVLLKKKPILSQNHDTVLAIDWPHYCYDASEGCGGQNGWCYTFQGFQANKAHDEKVAMVDVLAQKHPGLFAEFCKREVFEAVDKGRIPYPNIRVSGSGEIVFSHIPALLALIKAEIKLWGFTRNFKIGAILKKAGASILYSCDQTTPKIKVIAALNSGLPLAYTSRNVSDFPPKGTLVTFPLHRGGAVTEVLDHSSTCPKIIREFFEQKRDPGICQNYCTRCHKTN
jgi:hypothetical protein